MGITIKLISIMIIATVLSTSADDSRNISCVVYDIAARDGESIVHIPDGFKHRHLRSTSMGIPEDSLLMIKEEDPGIKMAYIFEYDENNNTLEMGLSFQGRKTNYSGSASSLVGLATGRGEVALFLPIPLYGRVSDIAKLVGVQLTCNLETRSHFPEKFQSAANMNHQNSSGTLGQ